MTGIYIHIPFCARKCPYCDFYSVPYSKSRAQDYVAAAVRNIAAFEGQGIEADTVYFGGGTPSLLGPSQVGELVSAAQRAFGNGFKEITLEANPCTAGPEKLMGYREAGVNRLSFGVQSAQDGELAQLGRLHNSAQAWQAVENAVKAGFDNISCDLMIGTPGQSLESLRRSVDTVSGLPITHISAYMLKIEEGTAFDCESVRSGTADEELMREMYLETVGQLEKAGFAQYEISNFSKRGFESRHNMKYWTGEDYIGIGAGAHSFFGGRRYYCPKDIDRFISSPLQDCVTEEESINKAEEYVLLGLRLSRGISLDRLAEMGAYICGLRKKAGDFAKAGLCCVEGDRLSLTPEGFLVSNSIIAEFIETL